MSNEIEEIRRSLSVERQIRSSASDWVDEHGADRVGRCTHPVHGHTSGNSDGTPNLIVTEDGGWYCYSHKTGGGIFEWIAVEEGICSCGNLPLSDDEFKKALREAADRAGVDLTPSDAEAEEMSRERQAQYHLATAVDILHDNLDTVIDGKTVRRIIKDNRGFDDATIDEARIGYIDDKTHSQLLDERTPEQLQDIGLYRDNNSLHVNGRIIYPYLSGGLPTYWIGRGTRESEHDAKYKKPNPTCILDQPVYVASPPDGTTSNEVWVAEGIQDAISIATEGGIEAISPVATNPSGKQMSQLVERSQQSDYAVVCFDNDEAGVEKAIDLALQLMRAGVETKIATVPDGDDPNDFLCGGGEFADLDPELAAKRIVDEQGDNPPVIRRILGTAEPDTLRADKLVDVLYNATGMGKNVLRKELRKEYREEEQMGWVEPVRISKTEGAETTWTFHYPDGTEIEMDSIVGRDVPNKFANKYASHFNYIPNLTQQEWDDYINKWLQTVEVREIDPFSSEGQVRETVLKELQIAESTTDISEVVGNTVYDIYIEDGVAFVENDTISRWVEDYDASLRQTSEYVSDLTAGGSVRRGVDYRRYRFWRFDIETIEDEGWTVPAPDEEVAPDPTETEDSAEAEVFDDE